MSARVQRGENRAAFARDREAHLRSASAVRPALVVISPESADAREVEVLGALLATGLERYHVRKPEWSRAKLAAWLQALPIEWRPQLVLHQHHELAAELQVGGLHFRDGPGQLRRKQNGATDAVRNATTSPFYTSRSCHDVATLRSSLGEFDAAFFSPVFPSISKPGHGPTAELAHGAVSTLLANRTAEQRRTRVLALGGITSETIPLALALGFDGVAALGAIWQAADPVAAFTRLQETISCHA